MRDAAIPPDGKNGTLRIFHASFCQPKVYPGFDIANCERLPVGFDEFLINNLVAGEQVACFLNDRGGNDAHLADAFDLFRTFGGTRLDHDQVQGVTYKS